MDADAARRGKADLVGGRVQAVLVVYRGQDLVDVGLEHHAAHDDLVEDVVNLPRGEGTGGSEQKGKADGGGQSTITAGSLRLLICFTPPWGPFKDGRKKNSFLSTTGRIQRATRRVKRRGGKR